MRGQFKRKSVWLAVLALSVFLVPQGYGIDHSLFIREYKGAKTCETCHSGSIAELQQTVHYKFESSVPQDYLFDEEGHPLEIQRSGKLWKLCGFPTTFPQFNWMGSLKDDPDTPHVDVPGGCARCHIGIGIKPFTAVGKTEVQESESNNVDCLICHAPNYNRQLFIAKNNGEPEMLPNGKPLVLAVPKVDGVMNFNHFLEVAKNVGLPKSEYCLRCHAAAGGGKYELDNMEYNFKRGSAFDEKVDVHAAAGMTCVTCHSAGNHKNKRSRNNDLYAYDTPPPKQQMCIECHSDTPHKSQPMYNLHTSFIACTACHAQTTGGAGYKDYADVIPPDLDDPLSIYKVKVELASEENAVVYRWFNGTVHGEIEPAGSRSNGKIYPYKATFINQPVDANNHPVPVVWGQIFLKGDVPGAAAAGRAQYEAMYTPELAAEIGIPPVPGPFDHFQESHCALFSLSHGITKENALTCKSCHSNQSTLNYAELGYSVERTQQLANVEVPDDDTYVSDWELMAY